MTNKIDKNKAPVFKHAHVLDKTLAIYISLISFVLHKKTFGAQNQITATVTMEQIDIEIVKDDIWDTYVHRTLNSNKSPLTQHSSGIRLSHFYHQFKYLK